MPRKKLKPEEKKTEQMVEKPDPENGIILEEEKSKEPEEAEEAPKKKRKRKATHKMQIKKVKVFICLKESCGHEWVIRTERPDQCPKCKKTLYYP